MIIGFHVEKTLPQRKIHLSDEKYIFLKVNLIPDHGEKYFLRKTFFHKKKSLT
jgi:hypothetical protein